ncbi:hypothetical protein RBU61_13465 [Tissierella sp. MB52-C2]|nr:hypothetical protein [Tissierella sp. MB52-C2]WMM23926.1 hypothetical protein RBU61_13465 [Tissierella sp. MB52-C2]
MMSILPLSLLALSEIVLNFILSILGVYTMILAIKSFKIYIKKNS